MKTNTLERQFKLWGLFLVLIPSFLIMAIYTIGQFQVVKQKNIELISQRLDFQKRLIEYWIAERADDVRKISRLEEFRALDENKMKNTLDMMQELSGDFDSLSYVDKNGYFKISTLSQGIKFTSSVRQPYFKQAALGKEYISDVVIGRNSGLPIINFSSPIYDNDGTLQGLILGSVRTITLETLLRENWIGQTGEIILINNQGVMIAEPRNAKKLIEKGLIEGSPRMKLKLSDEALKNIRLNTSWLDYEDKKVVGDYQDIPERNWTLVGSIGEDEIFAPIYTQLGLMASGTCILLIMILPLAATITNRLKRPIEWLIGQSNFIAQERYDQAIEVRFSGQIPYELDKLCNTFVSMSKKIQTTVSLLKENEAKLEGKVAEIEDVNARLARESVERKLLEEAHRAEAHERARIEKVATLAVMAAGIAHEINQPLNAIKVASGASLYWHKQGKVLDVDKVINDIKSIATQVERIDQIIKNIRSFAKQEKQTQVPVKLNDAISNVIQLLDSQIKIRGINLSLEFENKEFWVMIVPAALEGIIINLLTNAIEAIDDAGQSEKRIEICTWVQEEYAVVEISDNGPGIAAEFLDKIFEPFFSTKFEDGGLGLGLSIVHSFVVTNQGTITVERNSSGGATFHMQFPVYWGIHETIKQNQTAVQINAT
ncbi:cache domain-containing protein [Sporomusa sp. KB1]|jgi:C4-dicarboxylate-specific signal transduction histidine kinase|uniref:ATP-binding protein n=1 Tax=Sporomusa sp. KB1 TaxID=943346 RepID=UPI00119E4BA1|nr:cache domain-containing protein [Sporomusa sp. KB1]TWH48360.1 C4-dicarboxylate-specific signal transduction histidine kinase [Sporomusa sp. KB1]